jgi:hypothetical protein
MAYKSKLIFVVALSMEHLNTRAIGVKDIYRRIEQLFV